MMRSRILRIMCVLSIVIFCCSGGAVSRALYDIHSGQDAGGGILKPTAAMEGTPNNTYEVHNIGKMALMITNFGNFGNGFVENAICDGGICPSCEYPVNSELEYLFAGALWIGAVLGRDTLVSVGADGWFPGITELLPDEGLNGRIQARSNIRTKDSYDERAISEQDFICTFTDTFVTPTNTGTDNIDNRAHRPLRVAVKQSSYSWSYDYAEDFVVFDYDIKNIGTFPIRQMYMSLYVDADVYHRSVGGQAGSADDICGFRPYQPVGGNSCHEIDTINVAWIADNDGDPTEGAWGFASTRAVTGTRVLQSPNKDLKYTFNWWVSNGSAALDFGPRLAGTELDPYRQFIPGGHRGTPTGDRIKYYVMSHPEFDYDQLFTAISHTNEGFEGPPSSALAENIADGFDTRYLLSFGPFDAQPGDSFRITLAYVAGDNFHQAPNDFIDYFTLDNPSRFYNRLDFTDLSVNARWADWIFDNPGYDTNGDGDSGLFCFRYDIISGTDSTNYVIDTVKEYYRGDFYSEEPKREEIDLRGASPPPAPVVTVLPSFGKVILRWNGQLSEEALDIFSGQRDFEGYRVYVAEGDEAKDYVRLASFDIDDYKVFVFDDVREQWVQTGGPVTRDSLRILYGDNFDPSLYGTEQGAFEDLNTGTFRYFIRQDWNQSDLTNPLGIHKVYPEASKTDSSDTTDQGYLRYYEYEYVIPNLEPSKPYNFSVTAFDYGSLKVDLAALESSPLLNRVKEYPLQSADSVEAKGLEVMVFPNPYRIDGGYAIAGYENRDRSKGAERARAINFANLPRVCKIRIYTVDGDLVKEIDHNRPEGGPSSQVETWDVISRNTQTVVTGVYLWHVESEMGEQVGKLVIIK